jgi:hypothetical protein
MSERLGESERGWLSLREVGIVCERLGVFERLGKSVRDWLSL